MADEREQGLLASYLPRLVLERRRLDSEPSSEWTSAALLFVDLSGFTRLTEDFDRRGPDGAEQLSSALNRYFGRLIEICAAHSGDVLEVAGDAALVLWKTDESELREQARNAADAALRILSELDRFEPMPGVVLRARAALAAGSVCILDVGGIGERWECFVAGGALEQIARVVADTRPGTLVASAEAWQLFAGRARGSPLGSGAVELREVEAGVPAPGPEARRSIDHDREAVLSRRLPQILSDRLRSGQRDFSAEFRTLSIVFVNLLGLEYARAGAARNVHEAVSAVQSAFFAHDGAIYQVLADEKGTTAVGVFGLPPQARGDDATRAVQSALEIRRRLDELGQKSAISVSTGRVFIGVFGNSRRSVFSLRGASVNLAARLMAAGAGEILCEAVTARSAANKIAFEWLSPRTVRGRSEPVMVARPMHALQVAINETFALVGRDGELALLARRLAALRRGKGGLFSVVGEAGIGKSHVLIDLVRRARQDGVDVIVAAADAVERSTAYLVFREVLTRLLASGREAGIDVLRRSLMQAFADQPSLSARAPVLNAVLPLGLPDSAVTREMDAASRADSVEDLMIGLFTRATAAAPLLVVIDDAHWLDSSSAKLIRAVLRRAPGVLFVIALRSATAAHGDDLGKLLAVAEPGLRLEPLASDAVLRLVCQRLGARSIEPRVASFIQERSEGVPLYGEELALALSEAGHVICEGGEIRAKSADFGAHALANSLVGVIRGRIDRLTPRQQLVLKTASVIGPVFSLDVLHAVHPVADDRRELGAVLENLVHADVIRLHGEAGGLGYAFKHITTHEVAYAAMLFAERRALHRSVALFHEATQRDLGPLHALLAHHWLGAEELTRALEHLDAAARTSIESFANREAITLVEKAYEVSQRAGMSIDGARRARWERVLGEAHLKLADVARARVHLLRALELYGHGFPESQKQALGGVMLESGRQFLRRIGLAKTNGDARMDDRQRERERAGAAVYHHLAEVSFFSHDIGGLLFSTLASLNLAERAGAAREKVFGYGSTAHICSMIGMRGVARRYRQRSLELAEQRAALPDLAFAHQIAATFGNCVGDWREVDDSLLRAVEIFGRLGDRFRWETCQAIHGYRFLTTGEFARARSCYEAAFASAHPDGAVQVLAWTRAGRVLSTLPQADPDPIEIAELEALLERDLVPAERTLVLGALALAHHRLADFVRAHHAARRGFELLMVSPPSTSYTLFSVAGIAEILLEARRRNHGGPDQAELEQRSLGMKRIFANFARAMPVGVPRSRLFAGNVAMLDKDPEKAFGFWRSALRRAEELEMPYDMGLAHLQLGRHSGPDREARRHFDAARSVFRRLGADRDLARLEAVAARRTARG